MFEVKAIDKDTFQRFSESFGGASFVQTSFMGDMRQELGNQVLYAGVFREGRLVGAALIYLRRLFGPYMAAECHQGPLIDYSDPQLLKAFREGVLKLLKPYKVVSLHLVPPYYVRERDDEGKPLENGYDHDSYTENLKAAGFQHAGYTYSEHDPIKRWFFVKDIRGLTEDTLIETFPRQTTRWGMRKTLKEPYFIRELTFEEVPQFLELLKDAADKHDFSSRSLSYYQALYKHLVGSGLMNLYGSFLDVPKFRKELELLLQEQQNKKSHYEELLRSHPGHKKATKNMPEVDNQLKRIKKSLDDLKALPDRDVLMSAAMFVHYQKETTYLFSGVDSRYESYYSAYLLQYRAMTEAIGRGDTTYNFYGTVGPWVHAKDDGVYQFKKGFGGSVVEQPGSFEIAVRPFLYQLFQLGKRLKALLKHRKS